jgi:hypothetical protein
MQKLLRQKTSGHIFVWTPQLAERSDMEPYERDAAPKEQENTSENLSNTSAESKPADPLKDAKAAFRRQVAKPGPRTSARTSGGP